MFQILNPIWLLALCGILIPLIIHLWNVKKGKTLKIGSISLLGESSRQNARSLRLLDLLLLFLRCLLLVILALILAEPVWTGSGRTSGKKGWILIEKVNLPESYSRFKPEIDSLSRIGYEFHFFEPGFKAADIEDALDVHPEADNRVDPLSYWSLIKLLEQEIPENTGAYIFTPNRLSRLTAERPPFSNQLIWKTYTPADSVAERIGQAWFSGSDSIRAIIGTSNPNGTFYRTETIDPAAQNSRFAVNIENGLAALDFKDSLKSAKKAGRKPVYIDTTTIRIAIHTDKFQNDALYLKAAIGAIQKYTGRKIKFNEFSADKIPGGQNMIFWLSEKKISPAQLNLMPGSSLFFYESGKVESMNSRLNLSPLLLPEQRNDIALYKRIVQPQTAKNGFALWQDGFGRPILDLSMENRISVYHFYSRFNPEWNELVWNDGFTKALIPIILPVNEASESKQFDRRTVDQAQIIPAFSKESTEPKQKIRDIQTELKTQFWYALLIVFLLERYLSYSQNQI